MPRSCTQTLSILIILLCVLFGVNLASNASAIQPKLDSGSQITASVPDLRKRATMGDLIGAGWAVQVEANWGHTCALTVGGGVKCWGDNTYGQLGDGTTQGRLTPVNVVGLQSGVQAIEVGSSHSCAVMAGGGVKCWGKNDVGQLGDGTRSSRSAPVDVVGLSSGVRAVTAGSYHTCALTETGGVKCWGDNASGQLGDGTWNLRLVPVDVVSLTSSVQAISAGGGHTCALIENGGIKCWGVNGSGQLGDGTTMTRLTPVDVVGLSSGVRTISAGRGHTCAVTESGSARCWGDNIAGQLGNGTWTWVAQPTPVDVIGLQSRVGTISAGYRHTCAVIENGGAKCWGANGGTLGDGTGTQRLTPVDVVGLTSDVRAISAGGGHTCAVTQDGWAKCWGWNPSGQLGDGTTTTRLTPVDVLMLVFDCGRVTEISQGECAALVALFEGTTGVLWKNRSGWLQTPTPCSWYGVTCTADPIPRGTAGPD